MVWICENCGFTWGFPVSICIKCNVQVKEYVQNKYIVKSITQVQNPSEEHNEVPYFVLLLEDSNGRMSLRKSFQPLEIGQEIVEGSVKIDLPRIGIVGTGITGVGIAQTALISGCEVILKGRSKSSLNRANDKIKKALSKRTEVGKLKEMMNAITMTTDMSELFNADIVIEAVIEDIDIKCTVFKELDFICDKRTILATNTSSLSIDEIAQATNHPERVIGMHFFNPILKMRLVEIVYGSKTAPSTVDFTRKTVAIFNKTPVVVKNSPGFIVNRLLMVFLKEAVEALEENLATEEDIDKAIELGLNHSMGPLKLLDLIGIDTFHNIMGSLQHYKPERFQVPNMIKKMKENNFMGRKAGKGFYTY